MQQLRRAWYLLAHLFISAKKDRELDDEIRAYS
jgi:hypothetical protein